MGIGKGKSDKIDIDGLIESSDNEGKILQVERSLTENSRTETDNRRTQCRY